MDVLLLLSKKNTFGYNGTGDYYKLNYSNASKLTTRILRLKIYFYWLANYK